MVSVLGRMVTCRHYSRQVQRFSSTHLFSRRALDPGNIILSDLSAAAGVEGGLRVMRVPSASYRYSAGDAKSKLM